MRILVIQHDADKGLGLFTPPLAPQRLRARRPFAGHGELELADHAAVIALPGVANPATRPLAVTSTRAVLREALARGAAGPRHLPRRRAARRGRRRRHTHPCPPEWGYREVALQPAAREDDLLRDLPRRPSRSSRRTTTPASCPPGAVALAGATGCAAGLPRGDERLGRPVPPRADARDARRLDARARPPDAGERRRSRATRAPAGGATCPSGASGRPPWAGASRPPCARDAPRAPRRGAGAGRSRRGRRAAGAGA